MPGVPGVPGVRGVIRRGGKDREIIIISRLTKEIDYYYIIIASVQQVVRVRPHHTQ